MWIGKLLPEFFSMFDGIPLEFDRLTSFSLVISVLTSIFSQSITEATFQDYLLSRLCFASLTLFETLQRTYEMHLLPPLVAILSLTIFSPPYVICFLPFLLCIFYKLQYCRKLFFVNAMKEMLIKLIVTFFRAVVCNL